MCLAGLFVITQIPHEHMSGLTNSGIFKTS